MWHFKTTSLRVVIEALGIVTKETDKHTSKITTVIYNGSTRSTKIWIHEVDIFIRIRKTFTNVHKHTNSKSTKHLRLSFGSGKKFFYNLFEFKFFRHEGREIQFLSMLNFPSDPNHVSPPPQTTGLASASLRKSTYFVQSQISNNCFFFQIPKSSALLGMTSFTSPVLLSIWVFYCFYHLWLSHPPRTHVNTWTQCVHLTNPCTKPKGSKPN